MTEKTKIYNNADITADLGRVLREKRISEGLSLGDVVSMTLFSKSTIINIEKGIATNIHYYIAVGQALNISILNADIKYNLKPLYELSEDRKKRQFLTLKVKKLSFVGFFIEPKTVSDVIKTLIELNDFKRTRELSTNISRILLNLVEDELLTKSKKGRNNFYQRSAIPN